MSELKQFTEECFEHLKAIDDKLSGVDVYSEMVAPKRKDIIDSMEYIMSLHYEIEDKTKFDECTKFRKEVAQFFINSSLLNIIAKIITDCPIDVDYSKTGDYEKRLLSLALQVLFNYTDDSDSLANEVAKTEVIESCKTIFQTHSKQHVNDEITDFTNKIIDYCSGVVQNVSLRDCNVERLRSLEFTMVLQPYLKSPNEDISMTALTILANIVSEEECYIIGAHVLLVARLLIILERGLEEEDRRFSGWSCKELGHAVRNLARNDANKRLLWNLNAVQILVEMTRTGNDEEIYGRYLMTTTVFIHFRSLRKRVRLRMKSALEVGICKNVKVSESLYTTSQQTISESVHALWALAFDKEIRTNITSNQEANVVELLLDLQNETQNSGIRNACTKTLWTLREEKLLRTSTITKYRTTVLEIPSVPANQEVHKGHIMISYQTADRDLLCKVKEMLVEHDFQVWMAVDDISGSTLQAMADAVENASVVLLCFSRRYKENDNCRLEAEYAHEIKKQIVPLKMEDNYKPDGWLGLMLGSRSYVDFSGNHPFQDAFKVLFKELSKTPKQDGNTEPLPVEPTLLKHFDEVDVAGKPNNGPTADHALSCVDSIRQWSRNDVLEWLTQYNLRKQGLEKLTGEEIALLVLMRIETPEQLYFCIRKNLKIKTLQVTARLVLALLDLSRQ